MTKAATMTCSICAGLAFMIMTACMFYQAGQIFDASAPSTPLGKNWTAPPPNHNFHLTPAFQATSTLLLVALVAFVVFTLLAIISAAIDPAPAFRSSYEAAPRPKWAA